jgi:hypothetical protein
MMVMNKVTKPVLYLSLFILLFLFIRVAEILQSSKTRPLDTFSVFVKNLRPSTSTNSLPDPLFRYQWFLNGGAMDGSDMNVKPAWSQIHKNLFPSLLTTRPYKLERLSLETLSSWV